MYKINVKVEGNKVDIISQTVPITTKSLNVFKCVFDLPVEYGGLNCVAVFTYTDKIYKEMIVDNECIIPHDILHYNDRIKIGVYAFKGEEIVYSPVATSFKIEVGSYTEETSEETKFYQSAFDKLVEKMDEINKNLEDIGSGENGNDGFSPTIEEKVNDDDTYILEITTKDDSFETPNLRGKDGVNGQDGRDGADGINGKDGTDGKDGIDGQDGFSPSVIVKTDTDEEYILEITDKNRTFETSNLKGRNGDNGQTPVKGIDYFTEEEINEIKVSIENDLAQNILGDIDTLLDSINGEVI